MNVFIKFFELALLWLTYFRSGDLASPDASCSLNAYPTTTHKTGWPVSPQTPYLALLCPAGILFQAGSGRDSLAISFLPKDSIQRLRHMLTSGLPDTVLLPAPSCQAQASHRAWNLYPLAFISLRHDNLHASLFSQIRLWLLWIQEIGKRSF